MGVQVGEAARVKIKAKINQDIFLENLLHTNNTHNNMSTITASVESLCTTVVTLALALQVQLVTGVGIAC